MSQLFAYFWLQNTDESSFLETMSQGMSFGSEGNPQDETEDDEESWLMDSLDLSSLHLEEITYHEKTGSYYVTFPSDDEDHEMDETEDL